MRTLFNTIRALAFGAVLVAASPAVSAEAPWRITEITGEVRVARPAEAPVVAQKGDVLPVGTSVTTAAGARAELGNGLQEIKVGPNSRMTIAPNSSTAMTRILQDAGSLLFKVDKKSKPHFRVETPLLAAVVKGTTFTVTSAPDGDMVAVAEGLVEVNPLTGSDAGMDVPGGSAAQILRSSPNDVVVAAAALTNPKLSVTLPPMNYDAASNGIVSGAPDVAGAQRAVNIAALSRSTDAVDLNGGSGNGGSGNGGSGNGGAGSSPGLTIASLLSSGGASNGELRAGNGGSHSNIVVDAGGNLVVNGSVVGKVVADGAGGLTLVTSGAGNGQNNVIITPSGNVVGGNGALNGVGNVVSGTTDSVTQILNNAGNSGNGNAGNGNSQNVSVDSSGNLIVNGVVVGKGKLK